MTDYFNPVAAAEALMSGTENPYLTAMMNLVDSSWSATPFHLRPEQVEAAERRARLEALFERILDR